MEMEMVCEDCGMCQTHGNVMEIRKGQKDANGYTRCWPGKHAEGTKKGRNGGQVRNCVPNESVVNEYGDTAKGQKMLTKVQKRAVDRVVSKKADTDPKYAKKNADTADRAWDRMTDKDLAEGTKLVADGSVINAYYNGIHIGNIFASNTKDTPYKAYSKHWDMSRLFKSKKAAAEWLAQTHQTAIKEEVHNPGMAEDLTEEFDLIESIVDRIAEQNGVDAEAVWEDLESLTEDELYAFAVTSQLNEDWQKANKQDRTAGMSQKAVNAYRRENPGSKLKTAVTTKPSKLKKGSKASKRRKSYCSRSRGQMKMHNISCAKTPDKAICKARRRWNC
jgi:hypothetical protein